ncbi:SulP family inorganic anion transporter [Streptomyces sp. NPDC046942]|uniref:SulP family inorganic anion transporter n=1 Tax=Streptomyces sp. NPDC046942 TaxID=3155137 RepID=UPI0033F863C7
MKSSRRLHRLAERARHATWRELLPGAAALAEYDVSGLRADLTAGVTVAAVAIPASLGMAQLAGLPATAGLYASLLPLVAYALFTSSRHVVVGPDGTSSALVAITLAPLAARGSDRYVALAGLLAIMVGAILAVAGALRLGFVADFLSKPILIGYINGTALTIIASQLGKMTGAGVSAQKFIPIIVETVRRLGAVHATTLLLSTVTLAVLLAARRWTPKVPAALVVVVAADVASQLFHFSDHGIAVLGQVSGGLPGFGLPHAGLEDLSHLVLPAGGMALVAFCDTMANARSYAAAGGYEVSGERELAALGAADVVAGLSQGFPVSSSGSRTAVGEEAGGRSQLVGLSVAVLVAVFAAVGTPLIEPLPKAVLSAVVVAAAMNQLSVRRIRRLRMVHDSEAALAVAAMVGVVALGVLNGLGVAVLLSIGLFVHRSVRPHDAVLGETPDLDGFHDIKVHEQVETVPGLVVYRFDAPLFFPNARYFRQRVRAVVAAAEHRPRWVLVDAGAVTYVDATAVDTLRALHEELAAQGVRLTVARAKSPIRRTFDTSGVTELLGRDAFFPTVRSGVAAFREQGIADA